MCLNYESTLIVSDSYSNWDEYWCVSYSSMYNLGIGLVLAKYEDGNPRHNFCRYFLLLSFFLFFNFYIFTFSIWVLGFCCDVELHYVGVRYSSWSSLVGELMLYFFFLVFFCWCFNCDHLYLHILLWSVVNKSLASGHDFKKMLQCCNFLQLSIIMQVP